MKSKLLNYGIIGLLVMGLIVLIFFDNTWDIRMPGNVPSTITPENGIETEEKEVTYGIEIPYSWEEIVDDKIYINATIEVPDLLRTQGFRKAVGNEKQTSHDKIMTIVEEYVPTYDGEDEYSIRYNGKDGMFFSFQKVQGVAYLMTEAYRNIRMAYRDSLAGYNRDLYAVDTDLDSFSLAECDERLEMMFEKFGIQGDVNVTRRALDYQIMAQEAVELHMDGTETKPNYNWSVLDNSYHCTVSQACNEISIIPVRLLITPGDILNAGSHIFVLNKERVVGFDVDDIYDIEYQQEYENLLEFTDILNRFKQSPKLLAISRQKEITDITIRVIAVDNGRGEYTMTPVWIFYGYWFDEASTFEAPFAVILNAVTGDEL